MITPQEVRPLEPDVRARLIEEIIDRKIFLQWKKGREVLVDLSRCGSASTIREILKKYLPHWRNSKIEITKSTGVVLHIAE